MKKIIIFLLLGVGVFAQSPYRSARFPSKTVLVGGGGGGLTYIGVTTGGVSNTNVLTYAVDCTGANFLAVQFVWFITSGATITSVTYAGSPMTVGYNGNISGIAGTSCYTLLAPTTGTNNVVITMSTATGGDYIVSGAMRFSGVNVTTPVGTGVQSTAVGAAGVNVACGSGASDIVISSVTTTSTVLTEGGSQTSRWSDSDFFSSEGTTQGGVSPTVTPSWTGDSGTNWAIGAIAIKP